MIRKNKERVNTLNLLRKIDKRKKLKKTRKKEIPFEPINCGSFHI